MRNWEFEMRNEELLSRLFMPQMNSEFRIPNLKHAARHPPNLTDSDLLAARGGGGGERRAGDVRSSARRRFNVQRPSRVTTVEPVRQSLLREPPPNPPPSL